MPALNTSGDRCQRADVRRRLREWFSGSPGRHLLGAELEEIGRVLPDLFGYHLLQIGRLGDVDMLEASRVRNRMQLEMDPDVRGGDYPSFHGWAHALPVASDSIDVLLLPHVLEFEGNPHQTLREAERVLVPEGHVLVTGVNPWGFMGLWRLVLGRRALVPWQGHFRSLARIKDWLALLGFDILSTRTFFFRPPFRNENLMERLRPLDRLGARYWPYLGGGYLVLGRKRVTTLTPIRPRWRSHRSLVPGGVAEPTARTHHVHRSR